MRLAPDVMERKMATQTCKCVRRVGDNKLRVRITSGLSLIEKTKKLKIGVPSHKRLERSGAAFNCVVLEHARWVSLPAVRFWPHVGSQERKVEADRKRGGWQVGGGGVGVLGCRIVFDSSALGGGVAGQPDNSHLDLEKTAPPTKRDSGKRAHSKATVLSQGGKAIGIGGRKIQFLTTRQGAVGVRRAKWPGSFFAREF